MEAGISSDFVRHMKRTNWLEGLVHLVERPSDAELSYLYQNCLFSVYPSLYEGWGLPIGEALWHGRAVAASGTSSMPEVGGDLALYFDPRSLSEMISVIGSLIEDEALREGLAARAKAARTAGELRSWCGVATEFWTAIAEADARARDKDSISG
jgi:glycosyltransferase involved in cell wall biosynthesis